MNGKNLIAGSWTDGPSTFSSQPALGEARTFSTGSAALVDLACTAAEEAFASFSTITREDRAAFLTEIADQIEARGDDLTATGAAETGLPEARLQGERGRTTGQLRLFASHILQGDFLDRRHDVALPDRAPLPRPDLKMVQRPIGPVAVFGASNFPLAFSTAGGDTASALAAGCPVVVKGHPGHPGTSEIIAEAIDAARVKLNLHPGVFSHVNDGGNAVGAALAQNPHIKAVGFTGSLGGGRALFDLCAARPEPIPFFGELGSVNPVFLMPQALSNRATQIGEDWAGSLTMGAGQFCTNPGIAIAIAGADADHFLSAAQSALEATPSQTMLTSGIARAFCTGRDTIAHTPGVKTALSSDPAERQATAHLFTVSGQDFLKNPHLAHEVFGPLGIVVLVQDLDEMHKVANAFKGQLTATLQMDDADHAEARKLMPVLERMAGRVLANGFPTGVEVADAMVHGGPYPASTNFGATSVGTLAIRRFLRPVSYQNMPDGFVPEF